MSLKKNINYPEIPKSADAETIKFYENIMQILKDIRTEITSTLPDGTYIVGYKLTGGGVNGSVTVVNGQISSITSAT
jgi:hypothetical protein